MLIEPWSIDMLGGLQARQAGRHIERFRTRSVGALLTYLAFHLKQLDTGRGTGCLRRARDVGVFGAAAGSFVDFGGRDRVRTALPNAGDTTGIRMGTVGRE